MAGGGSSPDAGTSSAPSIAKRLRCDGPFAYVRLPPVRSSGGIPFSVERRMDDVAKFQPAPTGDGVRAPPLS
jgi:hypothetical protein